MYDYLPNHNGVEEIFHLNINSRFKQEHEEKRYIVGKQTVSGFLGTWDMGWLFRAHAEMKWNIFVQVKFFSLRPLSHIIEQVVTISGELENYLHLYCVTTAEEWSSGLVSRETIFCVPVSN